MSTIVDNVPQDVLRVIAYYMQDRDSANGLTYDLALSFERAWTEKDSAFETLSAEQWHTVELSILPFVTWLHDVKVFNPHRYGDQSIAGLLYRQFIDDADFRKQLAPKSKGHYVK